MSQETIARLRISLNDIEPEIWRTVEMPVTGSLKMLHDVIQAAMGWQEYDLWHFEAGDRRYGVPDPEWPDRDMTTARNVKLGVLIHRGVRQLTYAYDMGDDWRHTVAIEAVGPAEPDTKYPRFVAGERRCPPEDVGGFLGFELFLDAMSDPAHEEHQQLRPKTDIDGHSSAPRKRTLVHPGAPMPDWRGCLAFDGQISTRHRI